jgi:hypothetical protein
VCSCGRSLLDKIELITKIWLVVLLLYHKILKLEMLLDMRIISGVVLKSQVIHLLSHSGVYLIGIRFGIHYPSIPTLLLTILFGEQTDDDDDE